MTQPETNYWFPKKFKHENIARAVLLTTIVGLCLALFGVGSSRVVKTVLAESETPVIADFQARLLFDGYYREGGWLTAEVTITNGRNPFKGEIRSGVPYTVNSLNAESVNVTPVNLAPNQKERFFHYIQPQQRTVSISISLFDENNKSVSQSFQRIQSAGSTEYLIGVLDDVLKTNDIIPVGFMQVRGNSTRIRMLTVSSTQLSEHDELYSALDGLIVGSVDPANITPEKRRALLAWISSGGQLYFMGGAKLDAQVAALGLSDNLLPAKTSSSVDVNRFASVTSLDQTLELISSSPYKITLSRLTPQTGSSVAAKQAANAPEAGLPLVVAREVGQGSIVMSAANLLAQPMTSWLRVNNVWATVIQGGNPNFIPSGSGQNFFNQEFLGRALVNTPSPDLPDGFLVAVLIIVYAALVGPGSFLILRVFKRTVLAWVLVPTMAIVATIGVIFASSTLPVGDIYLSRVSLIESTNDDLPANVKSLITTFSATEDPYHLDLNGPSALLRPQPLALSPQINILPPRFLTQGSDSGINASEERLGRYEMFAAETLTDFKFNLEGSLSVNGETISGTEANHSSYRMSDVVLVYGDNFYYLGDWNPGEEKKINLPLTRRPYLGQRPGIDPNLYIPADQITSTTIPATPTTVGRQPGPWLLGQSPEARLGFLRWTTLNTAYQLRRFGPDERTNTLYLTGWVNAQNILGTAQASGHRVVQQDLGLIIRPIPLSYVGEGGKVQMPAASLLVEKLGDNNATAFNTVILNQSAAFFQFRLPSQFVYPRFQPTVIRLYLNSFKDRDRPKIFPSSLVQTGWREPVPVGNLQSNPKIELYNWEKGSWVELVPQGDNRERIDLTLPNLNEYIDRNIGTIQVRLSASADSVVLQQINLGVEGLNL